MPKGNGLYLASTVTDWSDRLESVGEAVHNRLQASGLGLAGEARLTECQEIWWNTEYGPVHNNVSTATECGSAARACLDG